MTKEEIKHINWIYHRLISVHEENPNYDYMLKLKEIIDKQKQSCQQFSLNKGYLLNITGTPSIMEWVTVKDDKPKELESIIGIEMPHEARYACHREGNLYISDETGQSVAITHWIYSPKPPCV